LKKRVVITGEGSISPLGLDSKSLWDNIINGNSGVRKIESFNTENFSVKIAGEITNFNPEDHFLSKEIKKLDRFTMLSLVASDQAISSSGIW